MLEKLGFQSLVEETLTVKRRTRVMSVYQFVLAMVLGAYVGFLAAEPSALHRPGSDSRRDPEGHSTAAAIDLLAISGFADRERGSADSVDPAQMRERVWAAANVQLDTATLDTDTTVHTLYGNQMGARKSYNPKNKGKKSYQPMLTFIAETREYLWGGLRNGDRPSGKEIARHIGEAVRRCRRW